MIYNKKAIYAKQGKPKSGKYGTTEWLGKVFTLIKDISPTRLEKKSSNIC